MYILNHPKDIVYYMHHIDENNTIFDYRHDISEDAYIHIRNIVGILYYLYLNKKAYHLDLFHK